MHTIVRVLLFVLAGTSTSGITLEKEDRKHHNARHKLVKPCSQELASKQRIKQFHSLSWDGPAYSIVKISSSAVRALCLSTEQRIRLSVALLFRSREVFSRNLYFPPQDVIVAWFTVDMVPALVAFYSAWIDGFLFLFYLSTT